MRSSEDGLLDITLTAQQTIMPRSVASTLPADPAMALPPLNRFDTTRREEYDEIEYGGLPVLVLE